MAPGLERLAAAELSGLGLQGETEAGGVSFRAGARELYQANLSARVVTRIVVRIAEFRATAFWELEKRARAMPWSRFIARGRGVTFRVTSRKSKLYHLDGIAERLASAAKATSTDDDDAQEFVVRVVNDRFTVSIDSSGALLHRRGYRLASAKAPLRENLGAAMLLGARWDTTRPLLDPFAGSGTIPIEAALLARRIPPGWKRAFAFEQWPEFDASAWSEVKAEAESQILEKAPAPILGSDRDAGSITAATANAERAGVADDIEWTQAPLSRAPRPDAPGWIVTNPPYGVRVGEAKKLRDLYATLGQLTVNRYADWKVALLSADTGLVKATGVDWEEGLRFRNGGISVRMLVRGAGVSS